MTPSIPSWVIDTMEPKALAGLLKKGSAPLVIDVRSAPEYRSGHIPGAVHLPFWAILWQRRKLPNDRRASIVITCEHGPRAELARVQLALLGYGDLSLLRGHMSAWRRLRLPVTFGK